MASQHQHQLQQLEESGFEVAAGEPINIALLRLVGLSDFEFNDLAVEYQQFQ